MLTPKQDVLVISAVAVIVYSKNATVAVKDDGAKLTWMYSQRVAVLEYTIAAKGGFQPCWLMVP